MLMSWLRNPNEKKNRKQYTNYKNPETQLYRVCEWLKQDQKKFMNYLIQTNAIILLPLDSIIKEIHLTLEFLLCHSIYLSISTGSFMTLNGLYGRIEKSRAKLYACHTVSLFPLDQKEFFHRLHSFHDLDISPICTNKLLGVDMIIEPSLGQIPVLRMKSLFYYDSCNWEWKKGFHMMFREKNEFSIYKELLNVFDQIRRSIPHLEEQEKERNEQYFLWDFDEQTKTSLIEQEEQMKLFYMKMSESGSSTLLEIINNFVNKFGELSSGKSIKKRKNIITKFILLLCEKAKELSIWKHDWNEENFINNMNRLLINKLFVYLWPPTIHLREKQFSKLIESDTICQFLTNQHYTLKPIHLGCNIDEENIIIKEAITFLSKIDSVCTPLEKIMYIFGAYKLLEDCIRFFMKENVTADTLFPLCLYITIKANLYYLPSTIFFIESLQMQINDSINYYYCNFMACKDFIEILCFTSFQETMTPSEYQELLLKGVESKQWNIPQNGFVIPQPITISQLKYLITESPKSNDDEFSLQYFLSIPLDEITSEDIPIILNLLQQLYTEK